MLDAFKKLKYGARVLLSRGNGQPETITVAGRPTEIRQSGTGAPFVYLHSTLGESSMWLPFYQTWAKQFQVFVPTHPGFSKNANLDGIDSIEDMVFHYVELFDALGLDQVVLGGVSLGGWIAAEFAVRWPERVRALWIADAPGLWVEEEPLPDLFRLMNNPEQTRELLFHDPHCYMADMLFEGGQEEERLLTVYQNLTALARLVWDRPYDPKLPGRLHRITCPTLLTWGQQDKLVPISYGEAYRQGLPGAEWHPIPDCGHLPMFECEDHFVSTVSTFVANATKG